MALGLSFIRCLSIVDDGYKPVPVVPKVEDYGTIDKIRIPEHAANVIKIVPADRLDKGGPCHDFFRRIGVAFHRLPQMLTRNDIHSRKHTSQYVKSSGDSTCIDLHLESTPYGLPFGGTGLD
jgi:hypothetical protein